MNRARRNPNDLRDKVDSAEQRELFDEEVSGAIVDMYEKNEYLSSVKYIQE